MELQTLLQKLLTVSIISLIALAKLTSSRCSDLPKLNLLPGYGWDALTNRESKQVGFFTYKNCKTTDDGKFLIPDNTVAMTMQMSDISLSGQLFGHWVNYTAVDSNGFRVTTDTWPQNFLPLYSSFSDDYQEMKRLQLQHEAITIRTQLRQLYYRVTFVGNFTVSDSFKTEILRVMKYWNVHRKALYLLEEIVRDYGTHYSKSVDVGAVLVQTEYLPKNFLQSYNRHDLVLAAKVALQEDFMYYPWTSKQIIDPVLLSDYKNSVIDVKMRLIGKINWSKDTPLDDLAVVERSGDLLTGLLIAENFANSSILEDVQHLLGKVIEDYYTKNIHKGCTRPKASNFEFNANLDYGCKADVSDYLFGGTFVTCEQPHNEYMGNFCVNYIKKNPLTKSLSCPQGFTNVAVYSQIVPFNIHYTYVWTTYKNLTTHICMAPVGSLKTPNFFYFGGLYSTDVVNVKTGRKDCPRSFSKISLFDVKLKICVSRKQNNSVQAIPFGGFITGRTGPNCPPGYYSQLAVIFDNNQIYYCLKRKHVVDYSTTPVLIRPPFTTLGAEDLRDEGGMTTSTIKSLSISTKITTSLTEITTLSTEITTLSTNITTLPATTTLPTTEIPGCSTKPTVEKTTKIATENVWTAITVPSVATRMPSSVDEAESDNLVTYTVAICACLLALVIFCVIWWQRRRILRHLRNRDNDFASTTIIDSNSIKEGSV